MSGMGTTVAATDTAQAGATTMTEQYRKTHRRVLAILLDADWRGLTPTAMRERLPGRQKRLLRAVLEEMVAEGVLLTAPVGNVHGVPGTRYYLAEIIEEMPPCHPYCPRALDSTAFMSDDNEL